MKKVFPNSDIWDMFRKLKAVRLNTATRNRVTSVENWVNEKGFMTENQYHMICDIYAGLYV